MQQRTYQKTKQLRVVQGISEVPLAKLAEGCEEAQLAAKEGQLAYMGRLLVQLTLPHTQPSSNEYERTNHLMTLSMLAPREIGLPYGNIPRLILSWLSTRAVQTRDREIYLGRSLNQFMAQLGLGRRGGARGDITRLKDQTTRLFATTMVATANVPIAHVKGGKPSGQLKVQTMTLADEALFTWNPLAPNQIELGTPSTVMLSEQFYKSILDHPVPLDRAILGALRRSPMALDIYAWLTWRLPLLREPITVAWDDLQLQFGAQCKRPRAFREFFLRALVAVLKQYPAAKADPMPAGLLLKQSHSSVPRLDGNW